MIDKKSLVELVSLLANRERAFISPSYHQAMLDQLVYGTGWYRIPATPTLSQAVRKMAEEEKRKVPCLITPASTDAIGN